MTFLTPVVDCWIKDANGQLGRIIQHLPNGDLRVEFGHDVPHRAVGAREFTCGILPGFIVQDVPVSAARRTLGVGTAIAVRNIAGVQQVSVQFHGSGETRWVPFERLARIMDPKLQYVRADMRFRDSGERTSLNLMAHALRTWNEATGALDRLDVDPLPHQITLVHRILSSGDTNWLIADDVGLGKTIEVGLLLAALERRQNLRRVLIVVPSGLTRQWKDEMLTKFNRQFRIYGRDFEVEQPNEWGLYETVIVSLDLVKPRNAEDLGSELSSRFGMILAAGKWDLVIFDEAHRLSRDAMGRTTLRFRLARSLRELTDSMVLLTGTPHQGDVGRFQNLLKLVRPELHESIDDLEDDPSIVPDIVLRNRKIDVVDAEGNFIFQGVLVRRAEIPNSPEAAELERRLTAYLRRGYRASDEMGGRGGRAIGFVMTIYRKLASSSVWALYVSMTKRRQRLLGEVPSGPAESVFEADLEAEVAEDADDLAESNFAETSSSFFDDELQSLDLVLTQARASLSADRKLLELEKIAADLVAGQHKKLLIFTEYRATQDYIRQRIESELGLRSTVIHGGMSVDEKQDAIADFDADADVLISTEAGGEGLNLQHKCHVMVNYDLPWNPARLQQRIGRLYRYGQKEKVVVINMTAKDTIDNEVLATVLERLEAVVKQMGSVSAEYDERHHAEVLGDLLERLDINELLEEARTGGVERTAERVDEAIRRAKDSKQLQDDILSSASPLDDGGWRHLGAFSTRDLASFIKRASRFADIQVVEMDDSERFDLRLPDALRGRFAEFGNKTFIEARTSRAGAGSRVLLDFSTSFVRHLVDLVTRAEFGGGYGVIHRHAEPSMIAAMLVHYQNEQGEPRGVDLLAASRRTTGEVQVDNASLRTLFEAPQLTGRATDNDPQARKHRLDAVLERIEADVAIRSEISRHAGGLFPIGIVESDSVDSQNADPPKV
jgi:superfamily II DNA or RNA helicase